MDVQQQELAQNEDDELAELVQILEQIPAELFAQLGFGLEDDEWIFPIIEHQTHSDE